jgi:hypothetical protein
MKDFISVITHLLAFNLRPQMIKFMVSLEILASQRNVLHFKTPLESTIYITSHVAFELS